MIQDKIFFDEKDPTGVSYNTPFTVYGSYQGRLWSKTPSGTIKYYTQNSDLSVYATTGSNQFSGSQTVTGSLTVTGGITGSVTTASYVEYTGVANKPTLVSGSSQVTYSGLTGIPTGIVSSSAQVGGYGVFATTGSNQFNGSQAVTGSLTVTGQVVAQTLNVQQVTSSIVYSSGSNIFGNTLGNTQQFTGSVSVTGSLTVAGAVSGTSAAFSSGATFGSTVRPITNFAADLGTSTFRWAEMFGYSINLTNNATISGTLGVTGSATFASSVTLSGTNSQLLQTINNSIAGDNAAVFYNSNANSYGLYIGAGSGTNHALYITDSTRTKNLFKVEGNGNVGICTASPTNLITLQKLGSTSTTPGIDFRGTLSIGGVYNDLDYNSGRIYAKFDSDSYASARVTIAYPTGVGTFADGLSVKNGNVGIGTTSPAQILDVRKATASGDTQFNFVNSQNASSGNTSVTSTIYLGFYDDSGGLANVNKIVSGKSGDYTSAPSANSFLAFYTTGANSSTERMRITSTGEVSITGINLTVGTGGGAGTLNLDQSTVRRWKLSAGGITSGVFTIINGSDDSPALNISSSNIVSFYLGGGFANQTTLDADTRFQGPNISVAAAKAYAWNTYSDQRIKENINPLSYGLNEILQLNPVSYNQYDSEVIDSEIVLKETYKSTIGLIAQEVNNLIPEAVGVGNNTELWGLDYDKIVPVLVKAIQELKVENDLLKDRLDKNNIN
jgi:hypothetical protein